MAGTYLVCWLSHGRTVAVRTEDGLEKEREVYLCSV
jgi:hypothetical protein